jgi:hypothetical protein
MNTFRHAVLVAQLVVVVVVGGSAWHGVLVQRDSTRNACPASVVYRVARNKRYGMLVF